MTKHWQPIGSGTWLGEYSLNGNPMNTFVVDVGEGRLAVFSPGPGHDDAVFTELDALGKVIALVSPGAFHNMGLPAWHARYPDATLYGTQSGLAHIAKQHPGLPALAPASSLSDIAGDTLALYETPGKKHGDLLMFVLRGAEVTLFNCEYLINWQDAPRNLLFRVIFKWTDSAPGLRLSKPTSWFLSANLTQVANFLLEKITAHGVTCFVPCHGRIVAGPDTQTQLEQAIRARL
jgi:hypothetical protein